MARATARMYFTDTYELKFPLKHPKYCVRDIYYDEYVDKFLAFNRPLRAFMRKIERFIRCMIFGDWKKIVSGITGQFKAHHEA